MVKVEEKLYAVIITKRSSRNGEDLYGVKTPNVVMAKHDKSLKEGIPLAIYKIRFHAFDRRDEMAKNHPDSEYAVVEVKGLVLHGAPIFVEPPEIKII